MEAARAVFIFIDHGKVVVDVAGLGAFAHLPTTQRCRADRHDAVHRPIDPVNAVASLLDDVIAGQPGEVPPVAKLPFRVGPMVLTWLLAEGVGVIGRVHAYDITDSAVVDLGI